LTAKLRSQNLTFQALIFEPDILSVSVRIRRPLGLKISLLYPPAICNSINDVTIAWVLNRFDPEATFLGDKSPVFRLAM
jgi:hypothetical protein